MTSPPRPTLKGVNNLLFTLIVLVNGYIMVAPLWPAVSFWWRSHHTAQRAVLTGQLQTPATSTPAARPQPNSLIIPAMLLDSPTLEGPKSNWSQLLRAGIWRWPSSSTPDRGGNTVFLAHRFSYTGPHGAFYYLDKLHPGDDIGVVWDHKTYIYTVINSRTVPPTDTAIENNTPDSRLTLFTCAPLWHPVNRLVVTAKLKDVSS